METNEIATIEEAQLTTTQWLWIYNNERPNMALGGITPAVKLAEAFKLQLSLKMGNYPANSSQIRIFTWQRKIDR